MTFTSFFGKIGHALVSPKLSAEAATAGTVVAAFNPGLGALIETVAGAVYAIETKSAPGTSGADKKDQVKGMIDVATPVALQVLGSISGKPVTDAAAVAPMLDSMIDAVVGMFNSLGVFIHSAKTTVVAPAVTAAPLPNPVVIPAGVPSAH